MSFDMHDMYMSEHLIRYERRNRTHHSFEQPTPKRACRAFLKAARQIAV